MCPVHVVIQDSSVWDELRKIVPEAVKLEKVGNKLKVCCRHFGKDYPKRIKDIKWVSDGSQDLPWFCSFKLQDTASKQVTRREFDAAFQNGEQKFLESKYLKRKEKIMTPKTGNSSQKKQRLTPSVHSRRQSQTLREILKLEPSKKEPLAEMEECLSFNQLGEFELVVSNLKEISDIDGAKLICLFQQYLSSRWPERTKQFEIKMN